MAFSWSVASPARETFRHEYSEHIRQQIAGIEGARREPELREFLHSHHHCDDESAELHAGRSNRLAAVGECLVQQARHHANEEEVSGLVAERKAVHPAEKRAQLTAIGADDYGDDKAQPQAEWNPAFRSSLRVNP